MSWRDDLTDAIKTGDKEQIKKVAELARNRYHPIEKPSFDYKAAQSEPGEDRDE